MWLSHHHPGQYDRCVVVGGRHVCRRCIVLYPGMLAVAAVQLAGWVPSGIGLVLMWVTPLGVVAEWFGEHLAGLRYSARRQVATTALASVSFGVALGRHVRHPFEAATTLPAVTFTVVCLVAWIVGTRRRSAADWEADFLTAEERRDAALRDLLGQPASYTKSMSSSTAPTNDGSRSL
jgi:hypothetical protein